MKIQIGLLLAVIFAASLKDKNLVSADRPTPKNHEKPGDFHAQESLSKFLRELVDKMFKRAKEDIVQKRLEKEFDLAHERSGSLGYGGLTGDVNVRLNNVRKEIKQCINNAKAGIRSGIVKSNRNTIFSAVTVFAAIVFGFLNIFNNNYDFFALTPGNQLRVTAQLANAYGSVTPLILGYKSTNLNCGVQDFNNVSKEYNFINYGGYNSDPALLKYYIKEQANRYKKALFCVISSAGSSQDAAKVSSLIDLQASLQNERLDGY